MPHGHNIGGIYDAMDFSPYVFKEYPKMLYPEGKGKKYVIVNSLKEELAVMQNVEPDAVLDPLVKERDSLANKLASAEAKNASNEAAISALMLEVQAMKANLAAKPETKVEKK